MLKSIAILSTFLLVGCATSNLQTYGQVDNNEKTITVPAGGKGLKGEIKTVLSNDGWKLSVYRGPEVTEGALGEKTKLKSYSTFNTRYSLFISSYQYDFCFNLQPAIEYDISIVDNKEGVELLTLDGRGCEGTVADEFGKALINVNNYAKR